jgi:hypothetical protein
LPRNFGLPSGEAGIIGLPAEFQKVFGGVSYFFFVAGAGEHVRRRQCGKMGSASNSARPLPERP